MNEPVNPYTPPKSNVEMSEDAWPMVPAGKGRRFGTLIVDYACYIAFSFCVGVAVALAFGNAGIEKLQSIPDVLLGAVMIFVYYLFLEGVWGRTVGKLIFGTVVVNEFGGKPSIKQVIGRTLSRFIPFEVFSGFSDRPWHDTISNTHVVLAKRGESVGSGE
jgi:uncharacterized RDD family membrane protein YckC